MKEETTNIIGETTENSNVVPQTKSPAGDLMALMNPGTIGQEIEEVFTAHIRSIPGIPDYMDPVTSLYPIFARTPDGNTYILDGSEKVYAVIEKGETSVRGIVNYINTDSEVELKLQKASSRMMPTAGFPRYPEAVRNTCILQRTLMESSEDYVAHPYGGDRKSKFVKEVLRQNVRDVMAKRMGKDQSSIGNYLSHGAYLTDEAFDILVNSEHGSKRFFERVQPHKMQLVKYLNEQKKTHEEIAEQVSAKIIEAVKVYAADKTKKIKSFLPDLKAQDSEECQSLKGEAGQALETFLGKEEESATREEPGPLRPGYSMQEELARLANKLIECSEEQNVTPKLVSDVSRVAQDLLKVADDMHRLIADNSIEKLVKDAA